MAERLDQRMVALGLADTRAAAQALILTGDVELADRPGRRLTAGLRVAADAQITVRRRPRWASRGGDKLAAALSEFAVDPAGLTCLDAGASTGGFTDVLLAGGARRVYAVDVGRGQLVARLAVDARVIVHDRTNLRTLDALPEPIDLATLDLSFISLALAMPAVARLLAADGRVVALVKPQFEAGREQVPRGGVIRDPTVHRAVLERVPAMAAAAGLAARRLIASPLTGGDGNREFLALLDRDPPAANDWLAQIDSAMGEQA